MSSIGGIGSYTGVGARPTDSQLANSLLASLEQTQQSLQTVQNQISSGKSVNVPSDSPDQIAAILALNNQLATRTQTDNNLQNASGMLNSVDSAMSSAQSLVNSTYSLGLAQISLGANTATNTAQAQVVGASLQSMLQIANSSYQNVSLFGGTAQPGTNQNLFSSFMGGVLYNGTTTNLTADLGLNAPISINSNGQEAFGSLTAQIQGNGLDPQATPTTQLSNISGATNKGFQPGAVVVTVDGTSTTVDLTNASNLADVTSRINSAITGITAGAGSVSVGGPGLSLTAAAGHTIQISDIPGGTTAASLGIGITATGSTVAGAAIQPKLTSQTTLASLGASVDWASGLKITQGGQTVTADFSSAKTVGDLQNIISGLGVGLNLQINSAGTGLNLVDQVSGIQLSVGENGGTTAQDLGLSTLEGNTTVASLNQGLGLNRVQGSNDFQVDLHDGTTFQVNLDGATTISDVVNDISSAAATAGLSVGTPGSSGTQFNVGLASNGNGLVLQDNTSGSTDFQVQQLGQSLAAQGLGIYNDAGSGSSIQGTDVGALQANNVFTHLIQLQNALLSNNSSGISVATGALNTDAASLSQAQAVIGTRSQQVSQAQTTSAEQKLSEQTMLSNLQDTDMTTAITTFTQLQNQLQGALQVGSRVLQLSLLNFLQ